MKYQESKTPRFIRQFSGDDQRARGEFEQRPSREAGFQPVSGTVLEKDESSITIKLPDGSSKIVLLSESSLINKTEEASSDDLIESLELVVFGHENSDESVTATNIQIGSGFRDRFNRMPEDVTE